jgi:RNA 3'-terminal phosphate cyclase (ATP)
VRVHAQPISINGSHGEGGGALLRTALAVSALTQQAVRVHNVRGAMRKPGLNSEDLTVIQALAASTSAEVNGDELGEDAVSFSPTRAPRALNSRLDVGAFEKGTVPGNALIVAESLVPVLARAGAYSRLTVEGETYNPNTLTFDAYERVTVAAHRRQGLGVFPSLATAGFGFGSKGEVLVEVEPSAPEAVSWTDRGRLLSARAVVTLADLAPDVGERGAERCAALFSELGLDGEIEIVRVRSRGPGAFVTVWAEFETGLGGGAACGQKGVRMEAVCDQAFRAFQEWYATDATVDPYLADQLLLPAALAEGRSVWTTPRVTRRLTTLAWVVKQFLPIHITVHGQEGGPGKVVVER